MIKPLIYPLLFAASAAMAQGVPSNVLVRALRDGSAAEPLLAEGPYQNIVRMIQKKSGDAGPVVVVAQRLKRFEKQPLCGRVVFAVTQPTSHAGWKNLGGQLNICDSGNPPLRVCADKPELLIPSDAVCADGSPPRDTAEVEAAIQASLASGGLSREQVYQQLFDAQSPPVNSKQPGIKQ